MDYSNDERAGKMPYLFSVSKLQAFFARLERSKLVTNFDSKEIKIFLASLLYPCQGLRTLKLEQSRTTQAANQLCKKSTKFRIC